MSHDAKLGPGSLAYKVYRIEALKALHFKIWKVLKLPSIIEIDDRIYQPHASFKQISRFE